MSKNKRPTWERSSQVDKEMRNNKPVLIRNTPRYIGWEQCVKDYFKQDEEKWRKKLK